MNALPIPHAAGAPAAPAPHPAARHSALYEGHVRHRRFTEATHAFRYRLCMLLLDLDELPTLFDGRWLWSARRPALAWFRRADHLGDPAVPLAEAVRTLVGRETGHRPDGPVRLLTHPRYFGYGFNPISLYYCYDAAGERVETVVAEVTNTPWGERHCYVLPHTAPGRRMRFRFAKAMHVSPFMDMDLAYDMRVTAPAQHLSVHMETLREGRRTFDATLHLRRRELTGPALAGALLRYPFMTGTVIAGIHVEALRLWLKGVGYRPHPGPAPHSLRS